MHIITRQRLLVFGEKHPDTESALDHWYLVMKRTDFSSLVELRQAFPHADQVGKLIVFNIGGNKARLITAIHFNTKRVFIRQVLTHAEYDRGKWKE
jgi:mRNA interferase HigB